MEIKILDSILHGELKPWNFDLGKSLRLKEILKQVKTVKGNSVLTLHSKLKILLQDYPNLSKEVSDSQTSDIEIRTLKFSYELTCYSDTYSNFYQILIEFEVLRIYNLIIIQSEKWTENVDLYFHISRVLTNIRVLAKQTVDNMNEGNFIGAPLDSSSLTHFVLYQLKHNLILLYFSIQEMYSNVLIDVTTLEDFYVLDLEESRNEILPIVHFENTVVVNDNVIENKRLSQKEVDLMNNQIECIEIALRKFIISSLNIENWSVYKKAVPSHIQKKVSENIEREQKKNPALVKSKNNAIEYLFQFTDLQELQTIIVAKENWEVIQATFGTKENLAIEFNNLAGLRNPIRHSRALDVVSILKGKAAISWFKQQLSIAE